MIQDYKRYLEFRGSKPRNQAAIQQFNRKIIKSVSRISNPKNSAAIDKKIEEQTEFVRWWKETVTVRHGGDRSSPQIAGLAMKDAEELTGISQQQVSRWRKARAWMRSAILRE